MSALAYSNASSYETTCGVGPANVDEEAATAVLKQLVDGGDIGYITEDTEADLFEDDETDEAELSLAKVISECLNAPNVVESIKNGTTTTEGAVKDIIATFRETHEKANKATPKAE